MNKIWILNGRTGEFNDTRDWTVGFFLSKEKADEYCDKCQKRANELENMKDHHYYTWSEKTRNEYDSWMQMDYTGTYYKVVEIEKIDEKFLDSGIELRKKIEKEYVPIVKEND